MSRSLRNLFRCLSKSTMADRNQEPKVPFKSHETPQPLHSVFPKWKRVTYVYIASLAAFTSPVASSIYLPSMLSIAEDLDVSLTKISLTITVYMVRVIPIFIRRRIIKRIQIFQGIAPSIIGGMSDRIGRRPAYLISFTLFIAASIGLALQSHYVALLVLRCVQSCGSSGTTVLSSATVSDVATRQQRGSYIGLAALGSSMGPALGPVIGGLLNHFLGWRSIFWFLAIYGGVMLLVYLLLMPETCRNVVGNGSLPAQRWNRPLITYLLRNRVAATEVDANRPSKKRPGFLATIPIILEKESFLLLFFAGLVYAGYYIVITSLPQQLSSTYHYNSIQVGLCYLPIGLGPLLIRPIIGRIMDANFRRHARKLGVEIVANKQHNIDGFPVEWARLQISLVLIYLSSVAIIPYGWIMGLRHPPLPAILVLLFFMGIFISATFQPMIALNIDINPRSPAAASAAGQFLRCLVGAGGVALVNPMLDNLGSGWTSTVVAVVWVVMSVCWWSVIYWGPRWRNARKIDDG
jgi:multidrug resistance protein